MKTPKASNAVRRSVAFVTRRKASAFRQAMAEMAADPAMHAENAAITREFAAAERDGLADD